MKPASQQRLIMVVLGATLCSVVPVLGEDPAKVAPDIFRTVFENNQVRVLHAHYDAGDKAAPHQHPDQVVYVLSGGKMIQRDAEGKQTEAELVAGQAFWSPALTHECENAGDAVIEFIAFEFKRPPESDPTAPNPGEDAVAVSPDTTKIIFTNDRVRLLLATLEPDAKIPMHGHPSGVVYVLAGQKLTFTNPDGSKVEKLMPPGFAAWHDPVQHAAENTGTVPARILNLEFKPPTESKDAPKPAPAG